MENAVIYTQLAGLLREDADYVRIAETAVAALRELSDADLALLARQDARERMFNDFWTVWVEPFAEARQAEGADDYELARLMGYQGVVIDNIMRLFAAGKPWRERVEALVPLPV